MAARQEVDPLALLPPGAVLDSAPDPMASLPPGAVLDPPPLGVGKSLVAGLLAGVGGIPKQLAAPITTATRLTGLGDERAMVERAAPGLPPDLAERATTAGFARFIRDLGPSGEPGSLPAKIAAGVASAPGQVVGLAPYVATLGPIGGFAAASGLGATAEGEPLDKALVETIKGAVLGSVMHGLGGAGRLARVAGTGGTAAAIAAAEGRTPQDIAAEGAVMGILGGAGARRPGGTLLDRMRTRAEAEKTAVEQPATPSVSGQPAAAVPPVRPAAAPPVAPIPSEPPSSILGRIRARAAATIYPEGETRRQEAERAANTDALTGLANRRALDAALPTAEADPATAVVAFDLNNAGKVNKTHSQEAGDQVIRDAADAVQQAAEEHGVGGRVFRRGGDEIVALVPADRAAAMRDRAEALFGEQRFEDGKGGAYTVSLTGTHGETFKAADAELQARKAQRKAASPAEPVPVQPAEVATGEPTPVQQRQLSWLGLPPQPDSTMTAAEAAGFLASKRNSAEVAQVAAWRHQLAPAWLTGEARARWAWGEDGVREGAASAPPELGEKAAAEELRDAGARALGQHRAAGMPGGRAARAGAMPLGEGEAPLARPAPLERPAPAVPLPTPAGEPTLPGNGRRPVRRRDVVPHQPNAGSAGEAPDLVAGPGADAADAILANQVRGTIAREFGRDIPPGAVARAEPTEPLRPELEAAVEVVRAFHGEDPVLMRRASPEVPPLNGMAFSPRNRATGRRGRTKIVLFSDAEAPLHTVAGHELIEVIKIERPELLEPLLAAVREGVDLEGWSGRRYFGQTEGMDLPKEFLADFTGEQLTRPAFWERLMERSPEAFQEVAGRFVEILDRILRKILPDYRTEPFVRDLEGLRDQVADMLARYERESAPPEVRKSRRLARVREALADRASIAAAREADPVWRLRQRFRNKLVPPKGETEDWAIPLQYRGKRGSPSSLPADTALVEIDDAMGWKRGTATIEDLKQILTGPYKGSPLAEPTAAEERSMERGSILERMRTVLREGGEAGLSRRRGEESKWLPGMRPKGETEQGALFGADEAQLEPVARDTAATSTRTGRVGVQRGLFEADEAAAAREAADARRRAEDEETGQGSFFSRRRRRDEGVEAKPPGVLERLRARRAGEGEAPRAAGEAARTVSGEPEAGFSRRRRREWPEPAEPDRFVAAASGSRNLGEIGEDAAREVGRSAGPIRLPREADSHIDERHRVQLAEAGYPGRFGRRRFVREVADSYDEIYRGPEGRLILAKRTPGTSVAYVELAPDFTGDYWSVRTAFVSNRTFLKNKPLLWERARGVRPSPAELTTPEFTGSPGAFSGQSNSSTENIAPEGPRVKGPSPADQHTMKRGMPAGTPREPEPGAPVSHWPSAGRTNLGAEEPKVKSAGGLGAEPSGKPLLWERAQNAQSVPEGSLTPGAAGPPSAERGQSNGSVEKIASGEPAVKGRTVEVGGVRLPLNDDGTVTLYHGTTRDAAAEIRRTGRLVGQEPDVYLSTVRDGTGYGDGTVVAVRVDPKRLALDDEFPNGRADFAIHTGRAGEGVPVAVEEEPGFSRRRRPEGPAPDEAMRRRARAVGVTDEAIAALTPAQREVLLNKLEGHEAAKRDLWAPDEARARRDEELRLEADRQEREAAPGVPAGGDQRDLFESDEARARMAGRPNMTGKTAKVLGPHPYDFAPADGGGRPGAELGGGAPERGIGIWARAKDFGESAKEMVRKLAEGGTPPERMLRAAGRVGEDLFQRIEKAWWGGRHMASDLLDPIWTAQRQLTHGDRAWLRENFLWSYEDRKAMSNERTQAFADAWRRANEAIGREAERLELEVLGAEGNQPRLFKARNPETYVPHILTEAAYEALSTRRGRLYLAMVDAARSRGMTIEQLWQLGGPKFGVKRQGSLEHARVAENLPRTLTVDGKKVKVLDTDPEVLTNHIISAARRINIVEQFGRTGTEERAYLTEVANRLVSAGWDPKKAETVVVRMWDRLQGAREHDDPWASWAEGNRVFQTVQAATAMSNLSLASIPNLLGGWVPVAIRLGLKPTVQGFMHAFTHGINSASEAEFRQLGFLTHDLMQDLAQTEGIEGVARKASRTMGKLTAFNWANLKINQATAIACKADLRSRLEAIRKGDGGALRKLWGQDEGAARRYLEREAGFSREDVDRMVAGGPTDADTSRYVMKTIEQVNAIAESPTGRSPLISHPLSRLVFAYSTYVRKFARTTGHTIAEAEAGNVRPLLTMLFAGAVGGEAIIAARNWFKDRKREETNLGQRLLNDFFEIGTFGMLSRLQYAASHAGQYGSNFFADMFMPPQAELVQDLSNGLWAAGVHQKLRPLWQAVERNAPLASVFHRQTERSDKTALAERLSGMLYVRDGQTRDGTPHVALDPRPDRTPFTARMLLRRWRRLGGTDEELLAAIQEYRQSRGQE